MRATGLKKGGIYNYFDSKDELALQAFDYAYSRQRQRTVDALRAAEGDPTQQLLTYLHVFGRMLDDPPVAGGCVLLNTAIESDDTHPLLRQRAQSAFDEWWHSIQHTVRKGIKQGVFRETVDEEAVATIIVSTLERALMLSRLHDDPAPLRHAIEHLEHYITEQLVV